MGIDDLPPTTPASPVPNGHTRVVPLARTTLRTGAPLGPSLHASLGVNTPKLGLIQPALLDAALITDLNYNFGVLDDALLQGTAGTLVGYTLETPVLIQPTIQDYSLAQHTHHDALSAGALDGSAIATGTIGTGPLLRQTGASAATLNVAPPLNLDGAAGTARGIVMRTGTPALGYKDRWFAGADATPETGDGGGSPYVIAPANDAGTYASSPALLLDRLTGEATFGSSVHAVGNVGARATGAQGVVFYDNFSHLWRSDGVGNWLLDSPDGKLVGFTYEGVDKGFWISDAGPYLTAGTLKLNSPAVIQFVDAIGDKVLLYGTPGATPYAIGIENNTLTLAAGGASAGVGFGTRVATTNAWSEAARINANGTVRGQALAPSVWLPGIAFEPGASPPTQRLEVDGDARRWVWRFSSGATNYMHCPTPIPVKFNGGTVRFTLYWRSVGGGSGFNWRVGASIRASGSAAAGNGVIADTGAVASTGANTTTITTWTATLAAAEALKEYIWYVQRMDSNGQAADVEGLFIEFGV